jgi:photosystem II stability/assembly factor-like uncharacterized protein
MKKILYILFVLIICSFDLFAENIYNFQATNGPYAGYIRSFCSDSTNNSIYANSDKIYKLNKTSNIWEKQFDILDKYSDYFYELIYADNVYFISFTEGHSDVIWGHGLLRSTDKGITWEEVKDFDNDIRCIVKLDNNLFATTGHYGYGVYKSTDLGKTWFVCNSGIDDTTLEDGTFDQLEVLKSTDKNHLFLMEYNNIFRSSDSGESWQNITGNISVYKQSYWTMTSTIDNKIFVATDSTVFTSTDFGETWQKISNGIDNDYSLNFYFLKSDKDGNIYGGGYSRGLFRLRKNENTWEKFNAGLTPNSTNDIGFDYSSNTAYCATEGGIYKSEYLNENWEFYNNGINTLIKIECLAVTKNGDVFAGSQKNGIYFTTDNGANWEVRNNGNTDGAISKIRIDSKGNIFSLSNYGNIFKSSNNGINWTKLNLEKSNLNFSIRDLAINSNDLLIALIHHYDNGQRDSMLISNDGGINWKRINLPVNYVYAGVFDNKDNLFIAADSLILRTSNNGISWEEVFKSNGYIGVFSFFVSKNNDIFFTTRRNKIYRSTDGGDSWIHLTNGFPDDCTISCISSPDIENRIIAGSHYDGYFVSKDNGENWQSYDAKLPYNDVMIQPEDFNGLAYDHNGTMYAATFSGVYKWDAITSVEKHGYLESNSFVSPNPAGDFITIQIQPSEGLKPSEGYQVQIFDVLGIEVLSDSIHTKTANHRINIESLPAGVYFIKIGDRVQKFVKM